MDEISGQIEKITFQNTESGFTIAQLKVRGQSETCCIIGSMGSARPGESIRATGTWKTHLIHGRQFEVSGYTISAPADVAGIKKYLSSGLIKGIGPSYASKIVETFGVDTLDIIENSPSRLSEVPGLGKKRMEIIINCWSEQKSIRDVMIFLQSHGVSPTYAQKIYKAYGEKAIIKVKENPYNLARDIFGIGFKSADAIAMTLGIEKSSPQRIDAGIEYLLLKFAEDGHVCYPLAEFVTSAAEILESPGPDIDARILILESELRLEKMNLIIEGEITPFLWSKKLFIAEIGIANELKRLRDSECHLRDVDIDKALTWVQAKLDIELAPNQKKAVAMALQKKTQIISGGPGTGKSTITNAIMAITEKLTSKILLAAPTGRAAKRMREITGRKASTLHTLLEFDFKSGCKRKRDNPLDCDLLIIDEASMIDTTLMFYLLRAIPNHARVIFVGDINQLPSVGPGNVLKDLIDSKCIPVTMLNEIFRQAAGSMIITNAHKINRGEVPDTRNLSNSDFYFIETDSPEKVLDNIVALVTERLPQKYGLKPFEDIQVLAPMKKGIIGIENLNRVLQDKLNPENNALHRFGNRLQAGDKIMQTRNNYKKNTFNGDIGKISYIDSENECVFIHFEDREVEYEFHELDEISLAYAVSIHKYQGSECPCIVMPVHTTHFKMLHRNLLYTGVTRGKKLVILVGTTKALYIAVKNDEVKKRYSGLQQATSGILNPLIMSP